MTRLMGPNEAQIRDMDRQVAAGADGESGIGSVPTACFKLDDCLAHRCSDHTETLQLNETCNFDNMAECGACAYEQGFRAAQSLPWWKRLRGTS